MGIKRYNAEKDNTITNAYKSNLTARATGSNMGLSDSLEVFRIYGQQDSGSSELSRVVIQFPMSGITTDRTNGIADQESKIQVDTLEKNCEEFGIQLFGMVLSGSLMTTTYLIRGEMLVLAWFLMRDWRWQVT